MAGTRRFILKTAGAAALVAVGAGGVWAATRDPKKAREPWSRAGGESLGDPRLDALAYAILAPNAHNMQPWRARLDGDDGVTIFCDLTRLLPETDPPNRQITVSFGCFLELLRLAALERGFIAETVLFPEGEPQPHLDARPIASVRIVPSNGAAGDPLFSGALARRTNRGRFDDRDVAPSTLDAILAAAGDGVAARAISDAPTVGAVRELAREAWAIEWGLGRTRRESIKVTRVGKAENDAAPWGISLAGPLMEAAGAVGVLSRANMDAPGKSGYEQTLSFYNAAIDSARAFVATSTATNSRVDQIAAGRAWVRMQLAATREGVAFHPLSQALQEFAEMRGPYVRAHAMLAHQAGATVQMLARVGYAPAAPPAPREALEAKLIPA